MSAAITSFVLFTFVLPCTCKILGWIGHHICCLSFGHTFLVEAWQFLQAEEEEKYFLKIEAQGTQAW